MNKAHVAGSIRCFALCLVLTACGGDGGPTGPGPDLNAMVTALLAEIGQGQEAIGQSLAVGGVSGGAAAPSASASLRFASSPPAAAEEAGACAIDLTRERFNCPARTQSNGLVTTTYFQLLDGANRPQPAFDTLTTAAIRMVTELSGVTNATLMTENGPVQARHTVRNVDDLVLSGIRTSARMLNGDGTMSVTIAPQGQPSVRITAPHTTTGLSFARGAARPYPISGTIVATVTSVPDGSPTVTTRQVTTYDASGIARLVITQPNGERHTCTYDTKSPSSQANCTSS